MDDEESIRLFQIGKGIIMIGIGEERQGKKL